MDLKIKKGLDLPLSGAVTDSVVRQVPAARVAVIPDDFPGFVPKVDVKEGETVQAGQPLMHHKQEPAVRLVSPVSGTVTAVVRGERRKVLRVEVEVSGNAAPLRFATESLTDASAVAMALAESGLLAMMRQRPYDIVPSPHVLPRDIFVTAFDSAPLAHNVATGADKVAPLAAAVKLLGRLTKGKIYISRRDSGNCPDIPGAEMVNVSGPHPAGLVGVQIANIRPVNKGETVWTMNLDTLCKVGTFATTGVVDHTALVAVTGSEVGHPYLAQTTVGACLDALLSGQLKTGRGKNVRIISGNVLTGVKESMSGYLHYPYSQVTVIPEGDDVDEFMGWASLSPKKMSVSPSYPGHWFRKLFSPDARTLGGRRAMIMSGEYDRYIPMDIMAEYLLKAINSGNIDAMERLGIYEVAPEDFALAEYADSSKQPLQEIVRRGLDGLRKEME